MAGVLAGRNCSRNGWGVRDRSWIPALAFVKEGAKVIVGDVTADEGEETVRPIREIGGDARFVRTDVSSTAQVQDMVTKAVETYGRLDCALNNAGLLTACSSRASRSIRKRHGIR